MNYFVTETERKASRSSCYFEFQRGRYQDKCWLADSLSLHDSIWEQHDLSNLFRQAVPEFDYYGLTEVNPTQWTALLAQPASLAQREILAELAPWAERSLAEKDVFTIIGI